MLPLCPRWGPETRVPMARPWVSQAMAAMQEDLQANPNPPPPLLKGGQYQPTTLKNPTEQWVGTNPVPLTRQTRALTTELAGRPSGLNVKVLPL